MSEVWWSITATTTTITGRGPVLQLPERPVNSITSVTDVTDTAHPITLTIDDWVLRAGGVLETPAYSGNLTVVYSSGWATLPDELIELVCGLAARLTEINPDVAAGVQQESGGSESVTFGFDSYNAIAELSTGEKRVLDRIFPARAGLVVMRREDYRPMASQTRF